MQIPSICRMSDHLALLVAGKPRQNSNENAPSNENTDSTHAYLKRNVEPKTKTFTKDSLSGCELNLPALFLLAHPPSQTPRSPCLSLSVAQYTGQHGRLVEEVDGVVIFLIKSNPFSLLKPIPRGAFLSGGWGRGKPWEGRRHRPAKLAKRRDRRR